RPDRQGLQGRRRGTDRHGRLLPGARRAVHAACRSRSCGDPPAQRGRAVVVGYPLALLSGGLFVLSFPRFGHPAFAWIALAPLVLLVATTAHGSTLRRQFLHGVTCGLIYFGGTLYWVSDTMRLHGGLPLVVSAPVAALLVAYLSIYVGAFALVLGGVVCRYRTAGIWFAPLIWV